VISVHELNNNNHCKHSLNIFLQIYRHTQICNVARMIRAIRNFREGLRFVASRRLSTRVPLTSERYLILCKSRVCGPVRWAL